MDDDDDDDDTNINNWDNVCVVLQKQLLYEFTQFTW